MSNKDDDIKKDILDNFYWDNRVNPSKVSVSVKNNEVTLTGEVSFFSARRILEDLAWDVPDVINVKNQIIVTYPESVKHTDADIKSKIEYVLQLNPSIDSPKIYTSVKDSVVTVKGTVGSFWAKNYVETLVGDIRGVTSVINQLVIVPTKQFLDEDIARRLTKNFEKSLFVDAKEIHVEVEKGKVVLSGSVSTWFYKWRAEKIAEYTQGVIDVKNYLMLKYI
jgi:osmotically-inducible protein OsmY